MAQDFLKSFHHCLKLTNFVSILAIIIKEEALPKDSNSYLRDSLQNSFKGLRANILRRVVRMFALEELAIPLIGPTDFTQLGEQEQE